LKNPARLQKILREIRRREQVAASFIDPKFPKQSEILNDKSRFQAWLCTRRGAKSNTFARKVLTRCLNNPGSKALYLALTLDSAKAILWDVIENLLDERQIEYTPHKQQGIFDFPNKSQLRFFGVDSSYKEMKKILGQKLSIVGIDESGSMTIDMLTLINQMISPALIDLDGDLVIFGTAENIPGTFHEQVTEGKIPGWKVHKWTTYDNPYMAESWKKEIERLIDLNPKVVEASWFKTHYLNQWCTDDDLKVYHLRDENICSINVPKFEYTGIGIDLGFNDATAFVVVGFNKNNPILHVIESHKFVGFDFTATAKFTKQLMAKHEPFKIIVDGANKQGVEEMRIRWGIPMESADKSDKASFMRLMDDDIKQTRILFDPTNKELIKEAQELMWLKDTDKEDPRCQNHALDALLYIWRYMYNFTQQPEVTKWTHPNEMMINQFLKEGEEAKREIQESSLLF
jgi:phage terminase large subunit